MMNPENYTKIICPSDRCNRSFLIPKNHREHVKVCPYCLCEIEKPETVVVHGIEMQPLSPEMVASIEKIEQEWQEDAIPKLIEYRREQARIRAQHIAEGKGFY